MSDENWLDDATVSELATRWHHARMAATKPAANAAWPTLERVRVAIEQDGEATLRKVYDNSLLLGHGFARFHRRAVTVHDLSALLPRLLSPCLHGEFRMLDVPTKELVLALRRSGCTDCTSSLKLCDWWREAASGLLLGLTGEVILSRHQSQGHGADECVDVMHTDVTSKYRLTALDAEMQTILDSVVRMVKHFDSSIQVEFLGVAEGVLHYEVHRSAGDSELSVSSAIERGVHRKLPGLTVREVSPRAVFTE